jgi:hypothetical protein
MGRPKLEKKKKSISLSIDKDININLEKYLKEKKISKSEYIEYLIKQDKKQKPE